MAMLFILATLATWSIGRLIQVDTIGEVPREWVSQKLQKRPLWHYLVLECLWCFAFWVAIPVTVFCFLAFGYGHHVLLWPLAIRVVVGMLELVEETLRAFKDRAEVIADHYRPEVEEEDPNTVIYFDPDSEGNSIA